jgi:general secretion pathway protein C
MNKSQVITYWQSLPWNNIKFKANKVLPKFIFIILIILITQTLAGLTWSFFSPEQESASNNNQIEDIKISTSTSSLKEVASYHLFGDAKQVVVNEKVIDAPETRLRLNLKGVFASTNPTQALAIISSSKGKDKTYHIGDKVTGGALLHAVYADRVILKRNGKLETLRLPKSKVDSKAFYNLPSSDITGRQINSINQLNYGQAQQLRKIRDTLLKEPAKVWQQVRINPVMKSGQVQGYTLAHNDQNLMKALHIRKTDIITAVNGQSLSDPATLYGLMNILSDQQSLELTIERNGRQQTIQLNF